MCSLLNLDIRVKADEINYNEQKFFSDEQELIEDYSQMLNLIDRYNENLASK